MGAGGRDSQPGEHEPDWLRHRRGERRADPPLREDEFSEHKSLEQQRIWPKGMPGGDSYAGTSCNGCSKANKITQRRGPTDWCVTLQQVVVGPHENPLRRRLQDVFEEYTNYSRWINASCLGFLLRRVVVDPLRPRQRHLPGQSTPRRLETRAKVQGRLTASQRVGDSVLICAPSAANLPHAAHAHSFPPPGSRRRSTWQRLVTSGRHTVRPQGVL